MAQFNSVVLTDRGISLISKALAGECQIEFTKVQSGDGDWGEYDPVALRKTTALKYARQEAGISRAKVINESTVDIRAVLDNKELTEGYYFKEFGIFACEKDAEDTTEVLYAIITAVTDQWDYMAPYNGVSPQFINFDTYLAVANASEVTIKFGSGAYASAEDIAEILKTLGELSNLKTPDISSIVNSINSMYTMFNQLSTMIRNNEFRTPIIDDNGIPILDDDGVMIVSDWKYAILGSSPETSVIRYSGGSSGGGNAGGTNDYNQLLNHPFINGVELVGNRTFEELGISSASEDDVHEKLSESDNPSEDTKAETGSEPEDSTEAVTETEKESEPGTEETSPEATDESSTETEG